MSSHIDRSGLHDNIDIEMTSGNSDPAPQSTTPVVLQKGGHLKRVYRRAKGSFGRHPDSLKEDARLRWLLEKNLNGYHSQLIALGSAIGTGLFLASGEGLAEAGPIPLLAAFAFVGLTFSFTVFGLGEMATCFPLPGGFFIHCTMFIDEAWGAAMGWNYVFQWLLTLPLELVASSVILSYWEQPLGHAVWVTIFLVGIIVINIFGVKGYGNVEAGLSVVKVIAIIGFIFFGILRDVGLCFGGQSIGTENWYNPGAARNGLKGFLSVLVTAAFAYSGSEVVGLTAAELKNPTRDMPKAVNSVFWRIGLFYILSIFFVGLLVPYNDERLLSKPGSFSSAASPFVIALHHSGAAALPHVFNGVILITVLSVANSSVYASSRVLIAMADCGVAPKVFVYVDTMGRPLRCLYLSLAFAALAYLVKMKNQETVFMWLLSLCGLSVIISWASICWAHIRFRKSMAYHKRKLSTLPYRSPTGTLGAWLGLICNILVIFAQFITAIVPIGYREMSSGERATSFFQGFMAFPLVLITFVGFKLFKGTTIEVQSWKDWRLIWGAGTKMVNLRPAPPVNVEAGTQTYMTDSEENDVESFRNGSTRAGSVDDGEVRVNWVGEDGAWEKEHHDIWAAEEAAKHPEDFLPDEELWWCPKRLRKCITVFYFPWDKRRE